MLSHSSGTYSAGRFASEVGPVPQVDTTAMLRRTTQSSVNPYIDNFEDAFGKSGGNRRSNHAYEAKYSASVQNVAALGRRPSDWMKRDLLAGAAGDDRRNFPQRQLMKNESTFLQQASDRLPTDLGPNAIRELRGFDYFNRRHQLDMKAAMPVDSAARRSALSASVCPTSLYQTSTLIPHDLKGVRNSNLCKNSWSCPHCYARRMTEKYQSAIAKFEQHPAAFMMLLSQQSVITLDDVHEFQRQRTAMKTLLQSTAESLGVTGGLSTIQVGPTLEQRPYWDQNEASYENVQQLSLRVAVMGCVSEQRSSLLKLRRFLAGEFMLPQGTAIDLMRAEIPGALRAMFVKGRKSSTAMAELSDNDYGLFHWPTMTLCSPQQWQSRFEMTRNLKCVYPWGDWRKNAKNAVVASTCDNEVPAANAAERRADLLKAVHSAGPDTASMGRVALREFLQSKGLDVSERDVRWLVTQRKQKGVA